MRIVQACIAIAAVATALPAADLVVDGTSYTIDTDTQIAGNVIVRNGGVLTITGCTLTLVLQYDEQYSFDISGPSQLVIDNAVVRSTGGQFWMDLYDDGGSPTLDVSGSSTWITNHSGIRPFDQTQMIVTGGDVEELQVRDRVTATVSNAALYAVMFFDGQTGNLSNLNYGPGVTTTVSVPGGWTLALNNATSDGWQIDLKNGSNVTLIDGDAIVLSVHTSGTLGPNQQVVDGVTSSGYTSGSLTNLGSQFTWTNSNIALFNVYVFGSDRVLLRNMHVNEANAEQTSELVIGEAGTTTLLNANLLQVYDDAAIDVVEATIDASGNIPSATASFHDFGTVGRGVMSFYDSDLRELYITAIEEGVINLCNCLYDPAKVTIVDPTATVNYTCGGAFDADFAGTPRIGPSPLDVAFSDLTSGSPTKWTWDFGDGGTSTLQNPSHTYAADGRYGVTLTASDGAATDTEVKGDYVLVTAGDPVELVTGPGPDPAAAPRVLSFDAVGQSIPMTDIMAYAVASYGSNVGAGDIDAVGPTEILTGPGPGAVFGPQVRAFTPASNPVAKVNYYAYGTLRYGVGVIGIWLDGDLPDEILTGAGPGEVFGPHVRGWNYDGVALAAIPGISFFSYGTLKYGVNTASAEVAGSSNDEMLTAPGPGVIFGPQLRGFAWGPPLSAIANINFNAFTTPQYGARVGEGDLDADGWEELLAGQGPGPTHTSQIRGFDYDDTAVAGMSSVDFEAIPGGLYGAEPQGGDLDGDSAEDAEIVGSRGPDPAGSNRARGFDYTGVGVTPIVALDLVPYGSTYGLHVALENLQ